MSGPPWPGRRSRAVAASHNASVATTGIARATVLAVISHPVRGPFASAAEAAAGDSLKER